MTTWHAVLSAAPEPIRLATLPTGHSDRTAEILAALAAGSTLQVVGDAHGISRQRVHQIVKAALAVKGGAA